MWIFPADHCVGILASLVVRLLRALQHWALTPTQGPGARAKAPIGLSKQPRSKCSPCHKTPPVGQTETKILSFSSKQHTVACQIR